MMFTYSVMLLVPVGITHECYSMMTRIIIVKLYVQNCNLLSSVKSMHIMAQGYLTAEHGH